MTVVKLLALGLVVFVAVAGGVYVGNELWVRHVQSELRTNLDSSGFCRQFPSSPLCPQP